MAEPYCYLNGKMLPLAEAKVGVQDIGLLRGFGVYEALAMFAGVPFEFAAHMARFRQSTEALKLKIPLSDEEIQNALIELCKRNVPEGRDAVVRFIITGGQAIGGIEYDPAKPTFYILVEPLEPLPQEAYDKGTKLIVHEHLRMFPEYKTTNYVTAVLLQEERKKAGAVEILYTHEGKVLECATSNFFIVKGGTIITPKDNILYGITRKVALDLAKKEFPVEERAVSVDEMYAADEAFLTSSFKEVVPVVSIDKKPVASGKPGPVSKRIIELFREFTKNY